MARRLARIAGAVVGVIIVALTLATFVGGLVWLATTIWGAILG